MLYCYIRIGHHVHNGLGCVCRPEINAVDKALCIQTQCTYASSKGAFWACVQANCATSQMQKRWIDTTHYSERRRSLIDNLESCMRRLCHGMQGDSLRACAMVCRPRPQGTSAMFPTERKRWLDPLNYGLDEKKKRTWDPLRVVRAEREEVEVTRGPVGGITEESGEESREESAVTEEGPLVHPFFCEVLCRRRPRVPPSKAGCPGRCPTFVLH